MRDAIHRKCIPIVGIFRMRSGAMWRRLASRGSSEVRKGRAGSAPNSSSGTPVPGLCTTGIS